MKTLLHFSLLACCLLLATSVHTQSEEYLRCLERGNRALQKDPPAFDEAINWYFIARWTPHIQINETARVDQLIDQTLHQWVDTLRQQRNLADSLRKIEERLKNRAKGRSINSDNTLRLLYGYRASDKAGYHLQQRRIHPAFAISFHALKTMINTQDGTAYDTTTQQIHPQKLPIPPSVYLTFGQTVAAKYLDTLSYQHPGGIIASGWSEQGQQLFLVGRDSMVSWYQITTGKEPATLGYQQLYPMAHSRPQPGLLLSAALPGSQQLILGSQDSLWQWNPTHQQFMPLEGGTAYSSIQAIDEERFFTGSRNGTLTYWNQGLASVIAEADQAFVEISVSADGDRFLARTMKEVYYGKVDELTATPLQPAYQSDRLIYWACLVGQGEKVLISSQQDGIFSLDKDGQRLASFTDRSSSSVSVAASTDGHLLLSATTSGELLLFEGREEGIASIGHRRFLTDSLLYQGFDYLTVNETGDLLAAAAAGDQLFLWQKGEWETIEGQNTKTISSICLSPSTNQLLAIGTLDGQLILWDIEKGFRTLDHQFQQAIMEVFFSEDGQHIYVLAATGSVYTLPVPDLVFEKSQETIIPQLEQIIQELHQELEDDLRT